MPAKTKLTELLGEYGQETETEESPALPETPVEDKKPHRLMIRCRFLVAANVIFRGILSRRSYGR